MGIEKFKEYIKFIYIPAWKDDDVINTRSYLWETDPWMPQTWGEYVQRIKIIQSFDIPVSILFQNGGTYKTFQKYYDLGIRYFTMGNDDLAKEIKKTHTDVYLVSTLTKGLTIDNIENTDYSMYDEIVLWFWFNRHLDQIKELPKKYKYCIQLNATCYYDCKWFNFHWYRFNKEDRLKGSASDVLPCLQYRIGKTREQIIIFPEDVSYFEPYLNSYKLIDRESGTDEIMHFFLSYVLRTSNLYHEHFPPININYLRTTGHARPEEFYTIEKDYNLQLIDDDKQYEFYLKEIQHMREEEDRRLFKKMGKID